MSFADGLQSGFNFAISAHKMRLLDEEEKRSKEIFDLEKQQKQADIDYREYLMSKKEMEKKESLALIESRKSTAERNQALTEQTNFTLEQAKKAAADNDSLRSLLASSAVLEDMQAWATDPELVKRINTPVFDTWASNTIGTIQELRDQDNGYDILEVLDFKTFEALENLAPILDSRDFSQINESNAADLTQLFKGSMNKYLGKQFKDSDLEGEITDVRLTGGFQALGNGSNTLVEAEYTVLDSNGNSVKKVGFLPDTTSKFISSEIEADDAKAVSVGDLVDVAAVTSSILTKALENPAMIDVAAKLNQRTVKSYYPPDRLEDAKIAVEADRIYSAAKVDYASTLATYGGTDIADTDFNDPEEVNELLSTLKIGFNDLPTTTIEQDGQSLLAIPSAYENIYDLLATQQMTFGEAQNRANTGEGILTRKINVRPSRYNFGDISFPAQTSRETFIDQLETSFGEELIDTQVRRIEEEFRNTYGTDIQDEQLLDQLSLILDRRS